MVTAAPAPLLRMRTSDGPVSSMIPDATIPGLSNESEPTAVFNDAMSTVMSSVVIKDVYA